MSDNKCVYDKNIPCGEAKKLLMFRDYVHYVAENRLGDVHFLEGLSCMVDPKWCPHYREYHNKPKCRYDANIICDRQYQLEEFYRQKSEADKAGKLYSFNTDGECPANPNMCARLCAQRYR